MLSYCLKYRKDMTKKPKVVNAKNGRIMVTSNCTVCGSKNRDLLKSKKLVSYETS